MKTHHILIRCAALLMCALFTFMPAASAATPGLTGTETTPSITPGDTPEPTPEPTPEATLSPQEIIDSHELPDYGILKEGDTGDAVILLQKRLRDLGYFTYRETFSFGSLTKAAVKRFQEANGLDQDGIVGGQTYLMLLNNFAKRAPIANARIPTPTPPPKRQTGTIIEWSKVKSMTKRGDVYRVKDYYTQKEYRMVRVGGYNHMDVEPRTKDDCAIFKSTYNGSWSWDRRPVVVRIGGKWYAGSINGMPHGYETVSGNNMNGQVCIHFRNSRTHGSAAVDSAHQRCVRIASGS